MFRATPLIRWTLQDEAQHAGEEAVERVRALAAPLRGARVLMLTAAGRDSAAEGTPRKLGPLLLDLGIGVEWRAAQMAPPPQRVQRVAIRQLARRLGGGYDAVLVDDPVLALLLAEVDGPGGPGTAARWVWWCHRDLDRLPAGLQARLLESLRLYDACVFDDPRFVPVGLADTLCVTIPPAVDPDTPRNRPLSDRQVRATLAGVGIDPQRPLLVQLGPLSASADPLGALAVYRRVKRERPRIQMLLLRPYEEPSAEVWANLDRAVRDVHGDQDVHLAAVQGDAGRLAVNAARRAAGVVMQRGELPDGPLLLLEAQWHGCPVVTGTDPCVAAACGAPTWHRATDEEAFAHAVLRMLADRWAAHELGAAGREHVRRRHLLAGAVEELARLLLRLLGPGARQTLQPLAGRDAPAQAGVG